MEALKTAIHILNRVPSKSVPKTPHELWTGRVPSLSHLKVWGSPAEAKVFNQHIAKLDPKTVTCHFIGYPDRSKGYRFYCPDRYTKFVEMRHAVFLEDEMMRGSMVARKIDLEEKRVCAPFPMIHEPFFALPVVPAPIIPEVVVQAPVVTPPVTTTRQDSEPVRQEPTQPVVEHERKKSRTLRHMMCQRMRLSEGLKELGNQLFLVIIEFIIQKQFIWKKIPLHMKKP